MALPKVLHIINGLDVGGAEILLLEICKRLHQTEFEMHVCALKSGQLEERFDENQIPLTIAGQRKYSFGSLVRLRRLLRNFKPSIIHTHLFHAGILGRLLVSKDSSKIVSTEHNTTDLIERGFLWRFLNRLTFEKNDLCIAVSQSVRDLIIQKTKLNPSRVKVIWPGIDLDRFASESVSRSIKLNGHPPIIGTIARLSHEKGIDILIKSFQQVHREYPHAMLHIVGTGSEAGFLQRLAEDMGLKKQIVWHGYQRDVRPLLRSFDCYVQPSRNESFGITILEAMASRVPVIASRVGGVSEIIKDGSSGLLVPPENDVALSRAILRVLKNPTEMKSLTLSAYAELEKHNMNSVAQQYAEEYRQML